MQDWLTATAGDLGRGIEKGQIDPVELTETYLAAIDEHPLSDRIYARLTTERARAEASEASKRASAGTRRSLLDGVPISWKDLYDTAGVATEAGSAMLKGRVPDTDALVLSNATRAGLVCLGKTHQPELAFSGLGLNPVTASPPCVNDAEAVSGGSSSGAAASVAFGLAAAGIGSDTGGSVRIPSVWNDLVGLKTVSGRLSLKGVVPLCARFDTVGPLCRSVEDAGLLLAALEDQKPTKLEPVALGDLRLAVLETTAFDNIEDAPRRAFEETVERLAAAGAKIDRIELPGVREATSLAPILFPAEAYATWRDVIAAKGDLMFSPVKKRFMQGEGIMAADFIAGWQRLDELRKAYCADTRDFDAVMLPTVPICPPKAEALLADEKFFAERNGLALQNTRIGNLMGLAGLTLPTGVPSTGILFQGPSEEKLLAIGSAVEAMLR